MHVSVFAYVCGCVALKIVSYREMQHESCTKAERDRLSCPFSLSKPSAVFVLQLTYFSPILAYTDTPDLWTTDAHTHTHTHTSTVCSLLLYCIHEGCPASLVP